MEKIITKENGNGGNWQKTVRKEKVCIDIKKQISKN